MKRKNSGLLKKLALAGAIAGASVLGPKESKAVPFEWGSFEDVIYEKAGDYPEDGGKSVNYISASINFTDIYTHNAILNDLKFSLVYLLNVGGSQVPIGGLDGSGNSASGWFNADGTYWYGLTEGQTANSYDELGSWSEQGTWKMFVDLNGDGNYGTYDRTTGIFDWDYLERMQGEYVTDFDPFRLDGGTLSAGNIYGKYVDPIPEPSVTSLLLMGAGALLSRRRRRSEESK